MDVKSLSFLAVALSLSLGPRSVAEPDLNAKFVEGVTGMPLPQYDEVWHQLHSFYGAYMLEPTYLVYTQSGISGFKAPDIVVLSLRDFGDDSQRLPTISHEASHLGTYALTGGQSAEEAFRFIDEGFAGLWQFYENVDGYKQYTMKVAKDYLHRGKVSFDQVQDWKTYFGNHPSNFDYNAYNVGSSFVFFLIDRYGRDGLKSFLIELGAEKDLDGALGKAFGVSKKQAEDAWIAYIKSF